MLLLVLLVLAVAWYIWERSQRRTRPMPAGLQLDISLPYEQEWELYHNDFSLCSKKTRVCLSELGISYRSHPIDLIETGSYENISRHFLKINPAATVPVLVHNGHPIYESHEQIIYAAQQMAAASAPLTPDDVQARALMDIWVHKGSLVGDNPMAAMHETAGNAIPGLTLPLFAAMIEHIPVYRICEGLLFHRFKQRGLFFLTLKFRGLRKLPGMAPLRKAINSSRQAMQIHFDELEKALSSSAGPWITGEQFTLADVSMMVVFCRLDEGDWLDEFVHAARPHVQVYWQMLQSRPSYHEAIVAHSHPLVTQATAQIKQLKQASAEFRDAITGH